MYTDYECAICCLQTYFRLLVSSKLPFRVASSFSSFVVFLFKSCVCARVCVLLSSAYFPFFNMKKIKLIYNSVIARNEIHK